MTATKTDSPKVTIGIPTFNRADFLIEAIRSSLAQTYSNIEVIVSDNASTDDTQDRLGIIQDGRLVSLRHEGNVGVEKNWNTCLQRATGEYFILLSDDDFLEPEAIERMLMPFIAGDGQGEIGMVYSQTKLIDVNANELSIGPCAPQIESALDMITSFFMGKRAIYPCGTLLRTSDIRSLGGYDEKKFFYALDAAVWMQIAIERGKVVFVNKVLSNYRIHSSNLTTEAKLSRWITGLEALIDAVCGKLGYLGDDAAMEVKRTSSRFKAVFIHDLMNESIRRGLAKPKAFRQYMAYAKYYFDAKLTFFLIQDVLRLFGVSNRWA